MFRFDVSESLSTDPLCFPMPRKSTKARAKERNTGVIKQRPWARVVNPYPPHELLSPEQVEAIHDTSMSILERFGIEFRNEEALRLLREAGAQVDHERQLVRFDRAMVMECVAHAPTSVRLKARNPDRFVDLGGSSINFDSVGGPPNSSDLANGRRMGCFADLKRFVCLTQSLNVLHLVGGAPIAAVDLDPVTRHLDTNYAFITLSDKAWHTTGIGRERVADAIDMLAITHGMSREELCDTPCTFSVINVNSPRRFDEAMADGLMELARSGQVACVTPFTLCGAMSPITLAGGLAQQNAEALAGIVLSQVVRPGVPVIYGGFTSNVDMKTGSPAFGTPEYAKACLVGGQMARRYGLPYRSSNTNASNTVDAQATYESSMSIWSSIMAHSNVLHHGAGWLEGGLTASFEKAIVDAEMLQMMAAFLEPLEVSAETLALEAIGEVEPGGHFFGASHTIERYEDAFYAPLLSDWRNFETWHDDGGIDATLRAAKISEQLLSAYQAPPLDKAIDEALSEFVAKRKLQYAKQANQ